MPRRAPSGVVPPPRSRRPRWTARRPSARPHCRIVRLGHGLAVQSAARECGRGRAARSGAAWPCGPARRPLPSPLRQPPDYDPFHTTDPGRGAGWCRGRGDGVALRARHLQPVRRADEPIASEAGEPLPCQEADVGGDAACLRRWRRPLSRQLPSLAPAQAA